MCVIVVAEKAFPDEADLKLFELANGDGAGVAWREDGKVHWRKNLTAEQIQADRAFYEARLPVILHFRIASSGEVCSELCHPFPLEHLPRVTPTGTSDVGVLFHNGTWSDWTTLRGMLVYEAPMDWHKTFEPAGWSDSRFMADVVSQFPDLDKKWLQGEKVCIMTMDKIVFIGKWEKYKGMKVSNNHFSWRASAYTCSPWGGDLPPSALRNHNFSRASGYWDSQQGKYIYDDSDAVDWVQAKRKREEKELADNLAALEKEQAADINQGALLGMNPASLEGVDGVDPNVGCYIYGVWFIWDPDAAMYWNDIHGYYFDGMKTP